MDVSNFVDISSNRASCDETKPVWREKVRTVVCYGLGCTNWGPTAPWQQDGGNTSNFPRQTVSLAVASAAALLALGRDNGPTPITQREPHLPASPTPLRIQE
jgi:hypothetical protein